MWGLRGNCEADERTDALALKGISGKREKARLETLLPPLSRVLSVLHRSIHLKMSAVRALVSDLSVRVESEIYTYHKKRYRRMHP